MTKNWGVEALVNYIDKNEVNIDGQKTDVKGMLYRLEALYHFLPDNAFVPYVALGAGNIDLNPDTGGHDNNFGADYGIGVKIFVSDSVALRADARHFIAFDQGLDEIGKANNNFIYTAGLNFLIGGKQAAPAPRDSDGDGVTDDLDKCPDTPKA